MKDINKKLDDLTRRLNKVMRSILLNSDPDELTRLSKTVSLDTWQTISRLLRTDVTLHPSYTEVIDDHDTGQRTITVIHRGEIDKDLARRHFNSHNYFVVKDPYCLAIREDKEYHDLFTNSDSDHAYMAHVIDGTCICWNGDIECGATEEERQDILNFRKGFSQDWWEKNT